MSQDQEGSEGGTRSVSEILLPIVSGIAVLGVFGCVVLAAALFASRLEIDLAETEVSMCEQRYESLGDLLEYERDRARQAAAHSEVLLGDRDERLSTCRQDLSECRSNLYRENAEYAYRDLDNMLRQE